jgi:uncharacterized protein
MSLTATYRSIAITIFTVLFFTGCNFPSSSILQDPTATRTQLPVQHTSTPGVNPTEEPPSIATPSETPQPTSTLTSTPDPYWPWTVEYLRHRDYGGGELLAHEIWVDNFYFTRYLISYPSDGLTIYGFLNLPKTPGPHPVVIALHGYIDPAIYHTLDYTTRYADDLALHGFVVVHPNLRTYPPSDDGENLFRVGMTIDVLNLIAIIKEHGGRPGLLESTNPEAIGLWGHSMGGGIATRVMVVSQDVDAVVLYASMSGDERKNFEAIYQWSGGQRGLDELAIPSHALAGISPANFLDAITAPISIHHGDADQLVPWEWSQQLCVTLIDLGKLLECHFYPGQPHTFRGQGDVDLMQEVADFFDEHLR